MRCWSTTRSPSGAGPLRGTPAGGRRLLGGAVGPGRPRAAVAVAVGRRSGQTAYVVRAEERELVGREHRRDVLLRPAAGALEDASRTLLHRGEDLTELVLAHAFLVEQARHEVVEDVAVLDEDLPRLVVPALDQHADLVVDLGGDLLGEVALVPEVTAEEDVAVVTPELQR